MDIDIAGLDKQRLLRSLWEAQATATFFRAAGVTPPAFDENAVGDALRHGYIDYVYARAIKADLSKDKVSPVAYDKLAGAGTMSRVVASVRAGGSMPPVVPDGFYCADTGSARFAPFGEPMLGPDRPDTVMCAHCGKWKKTHVSRK